MSKPAYKYLRPEDIRKLENFEFAPRALVEGYLAGAHRSRQRGSSIEFHEYRQYTPGDDKAFIDWRVYARTDRYYLRTHNLETNLEGHIFLDSSASMGFGNNPTKLEYASFFAAALAYLILANNDRVSLQIFDDKIRHYAPPGSTSLHLQHLMHLLETNQPGNQTSVAEALRRAYPLLKRKGTLVVISDFFDEPAAIFHALSPYLHRGFRIHLFHILAPGEIDLEQRGLAAFVDMETRGRVIAHTGGIRQAYREAMEAHQRGLRQLAARKGIHYTLARTDTSYFNLFDQFAQ
ncbi:MAG: DUF58 domain-containing protein [Chthoniobacteraceae bacterium]|nr:DUF58 domain-containing protein [Chthoniobacteraceae bacterium]